MITSSRACAMMLVAMLSFAPAVRAASPAMPSFAAVRAAQSPSDGTLLDRHRVPLQRARVDASRRQLEWVPLVEISPTVAVALVGGEDRRFFEHRGVDWSGLAGATFDNLFRVLDGRAPRGGSTLTMQLAALLDPALGTGGNRSLGQKWDQAQAALSLERTWTKHEIVEAYLNLAPFRGELTGIGAAAKGLFGKASSGIDADEAAILVALLRAPGAAPAAVAARGCTIVRAVDAAADCGRVRALATTRLAGRYRMPPQQALAPHVAGRLLRAPGSEVVSTLDAGVQRFAVQALGDHLSELTGRGVEDGAVVVLDNATGDVLAYVGSSGAVSSAREVDGAAARRQAGSTLKPFLYVVAIERRLLTAASLIDDRPLAIATGRGMYVPQNYDLEYRGLVSVRTALASSLNIPAVRALGIVGDDGLLDALHGFGFDTLNETADHYGAALALGSGEVTLLALTNGYRALANGGMYSPPRFLPGAAQATPRRVLGRDAAFIVTDILADRGARAPTFGLDNALATRVWSAAKTGTSKDMRDNWCVGYTGRYTVGVWVGNFSGAPMRDVSGVSGAAPVWRDIVHYLHKSDRSAAPAPPPGVVAVPVAFAADAEPARREWFLRGTEMSTVLASGAAAPTIRYPANDTIVALDPDVAAGRQRVTFEAAPAVAGLSWRIDDVVIADDGGRAQWMPTAGRHQLRLEDTSGRVLSRVTFEVRGDPSPHDRQASRGY